MVSKIVEVKRSLHHTHAGDYAQVLRITGLYWRCEAIQLL